MNVSLKFHLDVEDDWPPVGSEVLSFRSREEGFELIDPPLFVSGLSSGDIINVKIDEDGFVCEWDYLKKSHNSTIWILQLSEGEEIKLCLSHLRSIGCNTVSLDKLGCFSVDVPNILPLYTVDEVLNSLSDRVAAIAYPSLRHDD